MSLRIDNLNIQSRGPLRSDINLDAGSINLVYGRNERGKTMIVEFLLRSLFNPSSRWNLRSLQLQGSVTVSGLPGRKSFFPESKDKLDSLAADNRGLPYDLSRLLVVKGAELSFQSAGGSQVNRKILREYLSGTGRLDAVQDMISLTLREARIIGSSITGNNRGEIKKLGLLNEELQRIDGLFLELDEHYSGIHRRRIGNRLDELGEQKKTLQQARQFRAFHLDAQLHELSRKLQQLPEHTLLDLHRNTGDYFSLQKEITAKEARVGDLEESVQHTQWLQSAIAQLDKVEIHKPHPSLLISAGAALVAALFLLLLNQPIGVLASVLPGAAFITIYIIRLQKSAAAVVTSDQYRRIHHEFSERFPDQKPNLASMKAELDKHQPGFYQHAQLKEQIASEHRKLMDLQHRIQKDFRSLQQKITDHTHWQQQLKDVREQRDKLKSRMHKLELELASLGVDAEDYSPEDPGIPFSRSAWDSVHEEIEKLQREQVQANEQLHSLKQQFCRQTGDDISSAWEMIIQNLRIQRSRKAGEYRHEYAEAAGKIFLNQVIEDMRLEENSKIRSALQSDRLSSPLWKITRTYNSYDLEEDTLYLSGPHSRLPLADLSTGAREQVLLALRIGLASRLLDESAFFILDDAFQHADWKRREHLMKLILETASRGWQIFYFTMDDHIRRLFETTAGKTLSNDFVYYELEDS